MRCHAALTAIGCCFKLITDWLPRDIVVRMTMYLIKVNTPLESRVTSIQTLD